MKKDLVEMSILFSLEAANLKIYLQNVETCNFASHAASYICDNNLGKVLQ